MLVLTKKPELHITQKVAAENRHTGDTGNHGKAGNKSQPKERHSSVWEILGRSLATLLQAAGVSVKATQDMLRHASGRLTLDLYAQSTPADRRIAQSGVIGAVLNKGMELFQLK